MGIAERLKNAAQAFRASDGERTTLATPFPWLLDALLSVPTASGKRVTPATAMRASAVLACRRIISEGIASLPCNMHRLKPNGDKIIASSHALYPVLHSVANNDQTAFELFEAIVLNMLDSGTAYCQVVRDDAGNVTEILPLISGGMQQIYRDARGVLSYQYVDPFSHRMTQFTGEQIWRIPMLSTGSVIGDSITLLCREAVGLALAAEEHGASLFSNGAQIAGLLKFKTRQDPKVRVENQKSWQATYGGSANAHKTAVLEGDVDYTKIGLTAAESQYIEARKFQLAEIARLFRVPPVMLGMDDKNSTYASAEQFFLAFSKFTLLPYCVRIEQTITRDLLTAPERARGYFPKFNMAGMERADIVTRYKAYGEAVRGGFMNRNEIRDLEEMNQAEGLDEFLVPLNTGRQLPDGTIEAPVKDTAQVEPPPGSDLTANPGSAPAPGNNARLQALAAAAAERAVRRECKALRGLLTKGEGVDDFYAGHITWMQDVLRITGEQANGYCAAHAAALAAAEDKEQLINRWECEAADELAKLAAGGK